MDENHTSTTDRSCTRKSPATVRNKSCLTKVVDHNISNDEKPIGKNAKRVDGLVDSQPDRQRIVFCADEILVAFRFAVELCELTVI